MNRQEPTWEEQKEKARKLERAELVRHALIARQNQHTCRDCFLCACVVVLRERRAMESASGENVQE